MQVEPQALGVGAIHQVLKEQAGWLLLLFAGMLLPLWVFVQLADEVHELEQFVFDDAILLHVHGLASPRLDAFFVVVSKLGYQGVIALDVLVVLLLLGFRHWREGTFAAVAFIGSALLNLGTKQFFQRARPKLWESISPEETFSFPSGHAMGSMTFALVLVLLAWHTRWRWPVTLLAAAFVVLVGYSRVYLGVHFPSDILAGWMAATAWVTGVYLIFFHGQDRPWQSAQSS